MTLSTQFDPGPLFSKTIDSLLHPPVGVLLGIALMLTGFSTETSAQNLQCQIGFQRGSSTVTLDGNIGSGEWSGASVLSASDPCLEGLAQDYVNGSNPGIKNREDIDVRTKRNNNNLYLAFGVTDRTQNKQGGGELENGERVIVHLDGQNDAGSSLSSDHRIELVHKWDPTLSSGKVFDSKTSSCKYNEWQDIGQANSLPHQGIEVGYRADGNNNKYVIELKVPFNAVGLSTSQNEIRLAFAVVNDTGVPRQPGGPYYATAEGVPNEDDNEDDLSLTNGSNILNLPDQPVSTCNDWRNPTKWAVGYLNDPPGQVTISRNPNWWSSRAVTAHACDPSGDANYTYNNSNPCELYVKAEVSRSITQPRDVYLLYLWGEHGAGIPSTKWGFIALKREKVPSGSSPISFNSGSYDFGGPPTPTLNGHPCVRVYILSGNLRAGFDRSDIKNNTGNPNYISNLESAYNVTRAKHMAQKNLSKKSTTESCPGGCSVAGLTPPYDESPPALAGETGPSDTEATAVASPTNIDLHTEHVAFAQWIDLPGSAVWWFYGAAILLASMLGLALIQRIISWKVAIVFATAVVILVACGVTNNLREEIYLSDEEMDRYADTHVIAQVQTSGTVPNQGLRSDTLSYYFIQPVSGAIELVPTDMLQDEGGIPITLNVGNPTDDSLRLHLSTTIQKPGRLGAGDVSLNLDLEENNIFEPGESREIQGTLNLESTEDEPDGELGAINGIVTNEAGEPVPGVNVVDVNANRGTATNENGEFAITEVETGGHTFRASFVGYEPQTFGAMVEAGETTQVRIQLDEQQIQIPDIVVDPDSSLHPQLDDPVTTDTTGGGVQ